MKRELHSFKIMIANTAIYLNLDSHFIQKVVLEFRGTHQISANMISYGIIISEQRLQASACHYGEPP